MHVFLREIELMKRVSMTGNDHIVQIIGCIINEPPIAMVMEYVPFGDLHSNLLQWKEQVFNYSCFIHCVPYYGCYYTRTRIISYSFFHGYNT